MENKKQLAAEWIKYADRDLHTAEIVFSNVPEYSDMIGFHCQQVVEKYLKAYLTYIEIDFPKTHNPPILMDLIEEKLRFPESFYKNAANLSTFAVEVRYPLGKTDLYSVDLKNKIEIVKEFKAEILKRIK